MRWNDIRATHPDEWLVLESLASHREADRFVVDHASVVDVCVDGRAAMRRYADLRRLAPDREYCFIHTSSTSLSFEDRLWLGTRGIRDSDVSP